MSKNQKDQDNIEQGCLDLVKNKINKKDCFGMSNQQYIELQKWLKDAKPNQNSNEFPDFIFEDGFIEHFSVTSSSEGRKGAKQKQESLILKRKSETTFLSNLDSSEEDTQVSQSFSRPFEKHTHINIVNSIKKNWLKHIKSYEKKMSPSKHGIFLLEYIDINIHTAISRENEPAEIFKSYRISADKNLLEWIHTFKEKIEYMILVNPSSIEVIRIDQILNIIKRITEVTYAPIIGMESHKYIGYKIMKKNI
ncbi:hypothetical protein GCM10007216_18580 [Thalassobacillus devorans]|uniref:Uncharacterized protein n=1 Tax=Thalassobacillus devorans TaxID=279813 RepID=A0ABQ1NZW1_9BACI|nr:hypothetical protein [Thalassobacillus devorans]NIK28199.1 hypothetical protein [Thalassobacillus devorans]GGC88115.1 hypothetical protein GCM10007216_18580 [Thalassobacillus devorans]